jgi:amidase
MLSFISNYDVLLCPVCSFAGMAHGSTYDRLSSFSYTMTSNLTGWPAAVVRGGTTQEGLPLGVQIVARPWREDVALGVAQFLQEALGGWQRPPL